METLYHVLFVALLTLLFVGGAKFDAWFKNRAIAALRAEYDEKLRDAEAARREIENDHAASHVKMIKKLEGSHEQQLAERDRTIADLRQEVEGLKASWQEHEKLLAQFKGATGADTPTLVLNLMELNHKLNQALLAQWDGVEQKLRRDLERTRDEVGALLAAARADLEKAGHEVAALVGGKIPPEVRQQVLAALTSGRLTPGGGDPATPLLENKP